jgi:crotonobetainyl-CoA:carnitine CoA-transferase CaiB-like acyl-CoA transferase
LGIGNDSQWRQFCEKADINEWAEDDRFITNEKRVENRRILIPLLEELFFLDEISHWLSILNEAGVPCGPINSVEQAFDDPQVQAREMVIKVAHPGSGMIKMIASPLKIPTAPVEVRLPPPLLGEHTEQLLSGLLGYDQKTLAELRIAKVI